jgi:hypothetical protein
MDISGLADWLGIKTAAGREALANRQWLDISAAKGASYKFASCQAALAATAKPLDLADEWQELANIECQVEELTKPATDVEHETYKQLLFLSDWSKPLNFVPYLLSIWAVLRIYILPGLSLLLPLLVVILPYLIIRFMMNIPMNYAIYWDMLYKILKGQMPIGGAPTEEAKGSANDLFKMLGKLAWIGSTLFQALMQPYWNYKHLKNINSIITDKGSSIQQLTYLYDKITAKVAAIGIETFKNPLAEKQPAETLASILTDPIPTRHCLRLLGQLEVLLALASCPNLCPVRWQTSDEPILEISNSFDFHVADNKAHKKFNIDLSSKHHVLLTGPNRGGKSTVLRAILGSVRLAHTFGCAFGSDCRMTYLDNLFQCLKPDDLPGSKSRFEREVEFTAGTLRPRGKALILIDELYHSTNPADAKEACRYYLDRLWKQQGTMSVISTHIFDLVEEAPDRVQKLCCPARDLGDGKVEFLYGLEQGICYVSSVHELLISAGMR